MLIDANYFPPTGNKAEFLSGLQISPADVAAFPATREFGFAANNQIWRFDKLQGPDGGFDYYESSLAEPDVLLEDLISALHPSYQPRHRTVWLRNWAAGEAVVRSSAEDCTVDPLFGDFEPRADECSGIAVCRLSYHHLVL